MSYNDNNGYNNYGSYNDPMYNQNNYGSYNDPMYNQNNYGSYNNTMYNQNNYGGYDSYQQSVTNARVAQYNAQYSDVDYNSHEISFQKYNLIIGAVLLYGFLVNAFMVAFCADSLINFIYYNPAMFYISYFVLAIVGGLMVHISDNPIVSFIGYNMMVVPLGMVIAVTVEVYVAAGYSSVVSTAFLLTAIITMTMMFIASIYPNFFLSLGRVLAWSLLITFAIELISFFLGAPLGIIDYVVVLIFSAYIGYDWSKANSVRRTVDSAIDSASELYVDIAVLFVRLMSILARSSRN